MKPRVDVSVVLGMCGPERSRSATMLARRERRVLIGASGYRTSAEHAEHVRTSLLGFAATPNLSVVVEFPSDARPTDVIGLLLAEDNFPGLDIRLTSILTVVDASHIRNDFEDEEYVVADRVDSSSESDVVQVARASFVIDQIEHASVLALVNWSAMRRGDLTALMALLSHLNPTARITLDRKTVSRVPDGGQAPISKESETPGWVRLLNDSFEPRLADPRVSAFHYEQLRPLHPARLIRMLDTEVEQGVHGTVIRSAGFCSFATRPGVIARWDHIGSMISFEPLERVTGDELLAIGQDLAFIGMDLDRPGLTAALDACALTDAEFTLGSRHWATFYDPLPRWNLIVRPR
ncbi:GTP-binding protein [Luethyella okanaganae]|uniref:GTP-binding protein n=1 Tax=Luethyella okanaganae TaxID=69372 RepID=A0ABW1VGT4_9MICO